MAETRIPREAQNRERAERPKTWQPPELLPDPIREEGYAYRWIRVSINNTADPKNFSAKLREGWEPVRIEEQPHFAVFLDPNSRFKENIEIGGLLLCKSPKELVQQRTEYYNDASQRQSEGADNNFMSQNDARMPVFRERKIHDQFW